MSHPSKKTPPKAVVFGCAGLELQAEERRFFVENNPLGFILFARNCDSPGQVRRLVNQLRDAVERPNAPVLIDQEGGRVSRLKSPRWRAAPPAALLGRLYRQDQQGGLAAAVLNARLLADDLTELGIDVDCTPVLDLPVPECHEVIGDRAYGTEAAVVSALGRAVMEGLLAGGVIPVIKHIPGHGRATADSHLELPVVETEAQALRETDFVPFKALSDAPWAMTAHVRYTALDPEAPATTSAKVIQEVIRGEIGFAGVLLSDDLGMAALAGGMADRARAALAAGCDVALHCSGKLDEMREIAPAAAPLTDAALERLRKAEARKGKPAMFDRVASVTRLETLLGQVTSA